MMNSSPDSDRQTCTNSLPPMSRQPTAVKWVPVLGEPICALPVEGEERLCLGQICATLLKDQTYNDVHNRRVALGISCVQCSPMQLEALRHAGAMPMTSRRCSMITMREAERLCRSFLCEQSPIKLPEDFIFAVQHKCGWGATGVFYPTRYSTARAKCVQCDYCNDFFSPSKFIFHSHRRPDATYTHPDSSNFVCWRRQLMLADEEDPAKAAVWEEVKAVFNSGKKGRSLVITPRGSRQLPSQATSTTSGSGGSTEDEAPLPAPLPPHRRAVGMPPDPPEPPWQPPMMMMMPQQTNSLFEQAITGTYGFPFGFQTWRPGQSPHVYWNWQHLMSGMALRAMEGRSQENLSKESGKNSSSSESRTSPEKISQYQSDSSGAERGHSSNSGSDSTGSASGSVSIARYMAKDAEEELTTDVSSNKNESSGGEDSPDVNELDREKLCRLLQDERSARKKVEAEVEALKGAQKCCDHVCDRACVTRSV